MQATWLVKSALCGGGLRQGCFFCPNQPLKQFAKLAIEYPQLWGELVKLNELYRQDNSQFVKQGFKYGMTFDKLMEQVELMNRQIRFDTDPQS